jgi:pimeloyl-ACP methyl ester carboxylesterase
MSKSEQGVAEVNGTELYYESRGAGPPILFLHGFTLDRRMWTGQRDALAKEHRVVTYDARGFGRSAVPDVQRQYKHCEDAAALCEHLGLRRVTVVGHSIGGHQMLELALTRPDLVAGWAAVGMSGLAGIPFPDDIMQTFGAVREAARGKGVDAAKTIWRQNAWFEPARANPALARELDVMLADYSGWHWTHDNPAQNLEPPAAARLGELRMPALVITGGRDIPYNDAIGRELVAHIDGATALRLPNASHMANMEEPDAVNGALAALAARAAGR